MANRCRPWWLPHLLAAGVVVPVAAGIGLVIHSTYTDDAWAEPESGFAWFGVFVFTPVLVIVTALAVRAAARRDTGAYQVAAGFFALAAGVLTISLGEAALVALGARAGQLPAAGLAFVGGGWAYAVLMALGHWHLSRVFRPGPADPPGSSDSGGR